MFNTSKKLILKFEEIKENYQLFLGFAEIDSNPFQKFKPQFLLLIWVVLYVFLILPKSFASFH